MQLVSGSTNIKVRYCLLMFTSKMGVLIYPDLCESESLVTTGVLSVLKETVIQPGIRIHVGCQHPKSASGKPPGEVGSGFELIGPVQLAVVFDSSAQRGLRIRNPGQARG